MNKRSKLLVMLLILSFLVGCQKENINNPEKGKPGYESNNEQTKEFYKAEDDTFRIDTKYFPLYYSSKWENSIKTYISEENYYSVNILGIIGDNEIPVFSIVFDCDVGVEIGVILHNNKNVYISYIDYSDKFPTELNDEELDMLYQMNEDVNVIISNLVYINGMKLSNS